MEDFADMSPDVDQPEAMSCSHQALLRAQKDPQPEAGDVAQVLEVDDPALLDAGEERLGLLGRGGVEPPRHDHLAFGSEIDIEHGATPDSSRTWWCCVRLRSGSRSRRPCVERDEYRGRRAFADRFRDRPGRPGP